MKRKGEERDTLANELKATNRKKPNVQPKLKKGVRKAKGRR